MQLLAVILYDRAGRRRVVQLRPAELNIITGISATGKSTLLHIVEFCLGRDEVMIPVGVIAGSVAWYGLLLQLPSGQAFVARPAPAAGKASTSRAMLEFGSALDLPPFEDLAINADSRRVREELSRRIGIEENLTTPAPHASQVSFEAHVGHAALLCLQEQGEIANPRFLFHRQGEAGMAQAITDTLPYFLGAVPADQARLRLELQVAKREMRRWEAELGKAESINQQIDIELRGLHDEAYVQGLVPTRGISDRAALLEDLRSALAAPATPIQDDDDQVVRRHALEAERTRLRRRLREIGEQRTLLLEERDGEQSYTAVASTAVARLQAINILPVQDAGASGDTCPICGSDLNESDPTVDDILRAATDLQTQLRAVEASRPRRQAALTELDEEVNRARQELRGVESGLASLSASDQRESQAQAERQAFTKGRIDHYLSQLRLTDVDSLGRLREVVTAAQRRVEELERQLDPDEAREQLTSRLVILSDDMTRWAGQLQLEHAGRPVRLDLRKLTVVTDTESGPAPLVRVGSAENWVAAHIITHLALHRYFVRQSRPVPAFLMLDQPTQAYYPSDVQERESGQFAEDADRQAVLRLFELMRDVVAELAPNFQVIVCDHANLQEAWFQSAIRENWREGRKLIPEDWIE